MPDRMMFYEETYVVLSPDLEQKFVDLTELRQILADLLDKSQPNLPKDLQNLDRAEQIDRLIDTVCEFEAPEGTWQWYVVRLEK
jgi:hypothetical protein